MAQFCRKPGTTCSEPGVGVGGRVVRSALRRADCSLRSGDVVMESDAHPAVVVRITRPPGKVHIWARYVWQASRESSWLMGHFRPDHPFDRAARGEY